MFLPAVIFWLVLVPKDRTLTREYSIPAVRPILHNSIITESTIPIVLAVQADANLPVKLEIPEIKIDVAIDQVGLTAGGAMAVPENNGDVGWFSPGPRPGENGNAVIAGHTGWINGEALVFNNLSKLQSGSKIYITDQVGTTTTFVVVTSRKYDPSDVVENVFGLADGKSHLNLITCDGVWNTVSKSYPTRLVIFADKE